MGTVTTQKLFWLVSAMVFTIIATPDISEAATCSVGQKLRYNVVSKRAEFCRSSTSTWETTQFTLAGSCNTVDEGKIRFKNSTMEFCDGNSWRIMKDAQVAGCSAADIGKMRYSSNRLEFCDGSDWYRMDTAGLTDGTAGWFSFSKTSFNGNFGGLTGANKVCFESVLPASEMASADTVITPARSKAFLCTDAVCQTPKANAFFYFQTSAAQFTTNASGQGPGNSDFWNAWNYVSADREYWTGRAVGTATLWPTSGTVGANCSGWTSSSSGVSGMTGFTNNDSTSRWNYQNYTCDTARYLYCYADPPEQRPEVYQFTNVTGAAVATPATSNIVQITGLTGTVAISWSGTSTTEYRVCSDATCSTAPAFTTAFGTINNNEYVQIRHTSGSAGVLITESQIYVGDSKATWSVRTTGTVASGYFVASPVETSDWDRRSAVGGLEGGDEACYEYVTSNGWLGKSEAGTLTRGRVRLFACDDKTCQNPMPFSRYYFANTAYTTAGGDYFLTDELGRGPGDSLIWNSATKFNESFSYISNRKQTGSTTLWGTDPSSTGGLSCKNWSSADSNGITGTTAQTDARRWRDTAPSACSTARKICMVHPLNEPNSIALSDVTGAQPYSLQESAILPMTGLPNPALAEIRGYGSPQVRVCSDSTCSSIVTDWTKGPALITSSQYLQIRAYSHMHSGNTIAIRYSVGSKMAKWNITTTGTPLTGYFVLTTASYGGNFGGSITSTGTMCQSDLVTNNWLGKSSAGTLATSRMEALIHDGTNTAQMGAYNTYAFARAGSATDGGATMTLNESGVGAGDEYGWNGPTYFNGSYAYNTALQFGTGSWWKQSYEPNYNCTGWTSNSGATGCNVGQSTYGGFGRWSGGSGGGTCSGARYLCTVRPGAYPTISISNTTGVAASTTAYSNIAQATGHAVPATVQITGSSNPQFQVCSDASCGTVLRTWGTAPTLISANQYLQVRQDVGSQQFETSTANVLVGSTAIAWTARTGSTGAVQIDAIYPPGGLASGGGTISISGQNFASGVTATIGGSNCTSPTLVSANAMTCIVPAASGGTTSIAAADVVVTVGGSSGTMASGYAYLGWPIAWYSADVGIVKTNGTGAVSGWLDRSPNAANGTQATAANRPALVTSVDEFNNMPVVYFDGTNDQMTIGSTTTYRNIASASFVAAASVVSRQSEQFLFRFSAGSSGRFQAGIGLQTEANGGVDVSYGYNDLWVGGHTADGSTAQSVTTGTVSAGLTVPFVASGVVDFANASGTANFDRGTAVTGSLGFTAGNSPNTNNTVRILGSGSGATYWNGYIAEIIFWRAALNSAQRTVVENYVAKRYAIPPKTQYIFLTSGTSWVVPMDWNSASNTIEVIGGGGSGRTSAGRKGGGGGGAYSRANNVTLTPGATVGYQVGGIAQDTYFCNSTSNCGSIGGSAVVAGAKGGATATNTGGTGGIGGIGTLGVGATRYSGGDGGLGGGDDNDTGGGGGGAGGPFGTGGSGGHSVSTTGNGGGGGGGGGGGTKGADSTNNGGNGGNNAAGIGGGAGGALSFPGTAGRFGGGGGGKGDTIANPGGDGGDGIEWGTRGAGGGGGGCGGAGTAGGKGGLYGAGGGGCATGGAGAPGIIVIKY